MDARIPSTAQRRPQTSHDYGDVNSPQALASALLYMLKTEAIEAPRYLMKEPVTPCKGLNEVQNPPKRIVTCQYPSDQLFLNVDAYSMTDLLAPEHHLGHETGKLLNHTMDEIRYYFVSLVSQRIQRWNSKHPDQAVSAAEQRKLIKLTHAMLDNRKLMKGLAETGNDLRLTYKKKYGEDLIELSVKTGVMPCSDEKDSQKIMARSCDPEDGRASARSPNTLGLIATDHLFPEQFARYPFRLNLKDGVPSGRSRELLDDYIASTLADIHWDKPDIFIGFIPSETANEEVKNHGFLDSPSGGNLSHGMYSHALQMCLAVKAGLLDHKLLEQVIDLGLWDTIFDGAAAATFMFSSPQKLTDALRNELSGSSDKPIGELKNIRVCNPNRTILSRSPESLNMALLNTDLSTALHENLNSFMPDPEKKRLVQRWLGPHQFDQTGEVLKGLRALESVITRIQLEAQDAMVQSPALKHLKLKRGENIFRIKGALTGQFSLEMRDDLRRQEVIRYLEENKSKVYGLYTDIQDDNTNTYWKQLESPDEVSYYRTFIVRPTRIEHKRVTQ